MADSFTPRKRSEIMRKVQGKETKPEIIVCKYIYSKGLRYRKNVKTLPGKPDIVFKKYNVVIFIHGCFWHGHENCKHSPLPKTNISYWQNKILKNQVRDAKVKKAITDLGFTVITIWTCEIDTIAKRNIRLETLISEIKENYSE